ncbi:mitochondrial import inner membrane translocase subunit Tim23 isoform X2 [Nilaparvata lugens]|uniref:mitochondrial import inner membrane translocase subunit Tim23 isoform X2 n=1 Tax=Nilaparvata lugens TaxID=108931 RepID=UPI000B98EB92|nr:mitochondrial import inner membrane translocase subunit Tim23 isoform X2 [Nilaparvata lugens]
MNSFTDDSRSKSSGLSSSSLAPLSPYLNLDPSYLPVQPEYIFPEGNSRERGRFELAFSQIGGSYMIGAVIGGTTGFYNGLRGTTMAGQTGKLMRTQMLNHITKQGSATSGVLGVVTVMYSGFGILLSWARGVDDELNTMAAATATGMLYKSSHGLRKCGLGGAVGLGIASLYCLWTSRDKLQTFQQQYATALKTRFLANEDPKIAKTEVFLDNWKDDE